MYLRTLILEIWYCNQKTAKCTLLVKHGTNSRFDNISYFKTQNSEVSKSSTTDLPCLFIDGFFHEPKINFPTTCLGNTSFQLGFHFFQWPPQIPDHNATITHPSNVVRKERVIPKTASQLHHHQKYTSTPHQTSSTLPELLHAFVQHS